jgi:hypothetical protein
MAEHSLKIWAEYFNAVASGQKTVELRNNDRSYAVGDTLILREWLPSTEEIMDTMQGKSADGTTGRECRVTVTHITRGDAWLQPGIVALSICTQASSERLAALEGLWEAAKKRKWEWYAEPRDEFERALDDLARMEADAK